VLPRSLGRRHVGRFRWLHSPSSSASSTTTTMETSFSFPEKEREIEIIYDEWFRKRARTGSASVSCEWLNVRIVNYERIKGVETEEWVGGSVEKRRRCSSSACYISNVTFVSLSISLCVVVFCMCVMCQCACSEVWVGVFGTGSSPALSSNMLTVRWNVING